MTTGASLRFEKDLTNIDSFRGFIENFSLFSNRSEEPMSSVSFWEQKVKP